MTQGGGVSLASRGLLEDVAGLTVRVVKVDKQKTGRRTERRLGFRTRNLQGT